MKTEKEWLACRPFAEANQAAWVKAIQADALRDGAHIINTMSRGTASDIRAIAIDEAVMILLDVANELEPSITKKYANRS